MAFFVATPITTNFYRLFSKKFGNRLAISQQKFYFRIISIKSIDLIYIMIEASLNIRYHYNIPDQVKSGRPGKEKCLQDLITALLDCHENYKALSANTHCVEFKALYNNYANERADYAYTLYSNLSACDKTFVDENGHVIGLVNPFWITTEIAPIYGAVDIFPATITSECEAIKKYDSYLRHHIPIIPHLRLLTSQKTAINQTVKYLSKSIKSC